LLDRMTLAEGEIDRLAKWVEQTQRNYETDKAGE